MSAGSAPSFGQLPNDPALLCPLAAAGETPFTSLNLMLTEDQAAVLLDQGSRAVMEAEQVWLSGHAQFPANVCMLLSYSVHSAILLASMLFPAIPGCTDDGLPCAPGDGRRPSRLLWPADAGRAH